MDSIPLPSPIGRSFNRGMNKCRAPVVSPLLVNNIFVLKCSEKAIHFIGFFSQQCKFIVNSSVLPQIKFSYYKKNRSYNHRGWGNSSHNSYYLSN